MKRIRSRWSKEDWDKMYKKLERLSLPELRELSRWERINFQGGNESVKDKPPISAKEQFLFVLDEADNVELVREYDKILSESKSKA